ncbi:MAG: MFS transporter [Bacillota bacterium]|nr:MAG: MFS transporter [Bacillota bacterium]
MNAAETIVQECEKENWKRNIIFFLGSQTISLFGSSLVQYAILWYITLNTQSGAMMTVYILCGFLPTFLLSPFAGVWADRYNRKMLIIWSDAIIALATLILAIAFLAGYGSMWLLLVIAAIRALGTGVQTPAVGAILPQIVPAEQLTKVNGTNGSLQALIMFIAPMVSAALLTTSAIETILFIDVLTAIVGIVTLLAFVRVKAHSKASEAQATSYFDDIKLGLSYIRSHRFLKNLFLFFAIFYFLMAPAAFLTPLQVARSFGDDVWRLSAIEIVFSAGMMAGGGLIAAWGGFPNKVHTMAFASGIMGACTFALGVVPHFWLYLLIMAVFGVVMPVFQTPTNVLVQEKVDENYLGRVFGVFGMISTSMMPVGMLLFGPIADVVKIEWLLVGTGVLTLVLTLFLARNRVLLEAGAP